MGSIQDKLSSRVELVFEIRIHACSVIGGSTWQPFLVSWFLHLLGPTGPPQVPCPSGHSSAGIIKRSLCFCYPNAHLAFIPKADFTLALKICNHPAAGKRVYHLAFCPENKMLQKGHQKKKVSWERQRKKKKPLSQG